MRDEATLLGQIEAFVGVLAQCQRIGINVVSARENELILELPYSEDIIGNPDTGVIHGGAITTLMDTTAGAAVLCALPDFELCPTLDLRVDYMRSAKPGQPVYARASCYRVTSSILFMRCEAYQVDRTVAHCVATFMRMGAKGVPNLEVMTQGRALPAMQTRTHKPLQTNLRDVVANIQASSDRSALAPAIPYAQTIGADFSDASDTQTFVLKQRDSNLGNPIIPAIHGGVIGGFMELSGAMHLLVSQSTPKFPKIIDFSVDYLRAGQNKDTFAFCEVTRQGSRVANVEVHAWQDSKSHPIALARAHFLLEDEHCAK